jgi:hypothetical protein
MSFLLPIRTLRLLARRLLARRPLARRPARAGLQPLALRIPQQRLFVTAARRLGSPNDAADGLRNNRDLQPPAGVSRADASLLSRLGGGPAADVPSYAMVFTCRKCGERSAHRVSKQGYHHGTVLITCPGCKNRHLMSDHLKVSRSYPLVI